MKKHKFLTGALATLLVLVNILPATASNVSTSQYFKNNAGAIETVDPTYTLGSSGNRIAKVWTSDLDATAVAIGGAITGDISATGKLKLKETGASPTYFTTLSSGDLTGADLNYTMPIAFGSAGCALTDAAGNGTLSCVVPGGGWGLTGNTGTTAGTNFIGTTDDVDFVLKRWGGTAGRLGKSSVAFGPNALGTSLTQFDTSNTAMGALSLYNVAAGQTGNVGVGYSAGRYETGSNSFYVDNQDRTNTAGDKAGALLYGVFNATPSSQTLTTNAALTSTYGVNVPTGQNYKKNGTAIENVLAGRVATSFGINGIPSTVSGDYNTQFGSENLKVLTSGSYNTAVGVYNLYSLTEGRDNVAIGYNSMYSPTTGSYNTAVGTNTLVNYSAGDSGGVALGYHAGYYETESNAFYIDNQDRTNTAGEKAGALLYGTFNATPASQTLVTNAYMTATYGINTKYIDGTNLKNLTSATATDVVGIALASNSYEGGIFEYTIYATDGNDFQARSGKIPFAIVNKAGTNTCTVDAADADEVIAVSAGTLTNTFDCDATPGWGAKIRATADSSLAETTLKVEYRVVMTSNTGTIYPQ